MITDMSETTAELFLSFSRDRLQFLASRIIDCVGRLSNDQLWARGSANENSIGNLVLHLCGNVHQRIVSGVGGETDVRDRDSEFSPGKFSKKCFSRLVQTTTGDKGNDSQSHANPLVQRVRGDMPVGRQNGGADGEGSLTAQGPSMARK